MRLRRYLVPVIAVLAVVVAVGWYLRDTLIERLSVPLLAAYGFRISDVSLDTLASRDASISRLELVHENGTVIRIEDLSLPFRADMAGVRSWRAGSVRIVTAPANEDQPAETAAWLERFLAVPHDLPGSDFSVASLVVPPYPPVADLHWVLAGETQALRASVDGFDVALAVAETGSGSHAVFLSTGGQDIAAELTRVPAEYRLAGRATTDLLPWAPIAARAGLLPGGIVVSAGSATVGFDVAIPATAGAAIDVRGTLVPTSPLELRYVTDGAELSATIVPGEAPFEFAAALPGSDWHVGRAATAMSVDAGPWRGAKLQIDDLDCNAGPTCRMQVRAEVPAAAFPGGESGRIDASANLDIRIGEGGGRVDVLPDATLRVAGLVIAGVPVDRVEATVVSMARIERRESGWIATADSIDAGVEGMHLSDSMALSLPLYLERVELTAAETLSLRAGVFAPSSRLVLPATVVSAPGMRGDVVLEGGSVDGTLATVGLQRDGVVRVHLDTGSGAGRLTVEEAQVSFGTRTLADRFKPWPYPFSLSAGTLSIDLDAAWRDADMTGDGTVTLAGAAGFYDDIAFTGLSTTLVARYGSGTGFAFEPAALSIGLVDIGLPLENITARYVPTVDPYVVEVEDLRMEAFDGVVRIDPFSYRTGASDNHLLVHAQNINMAELLAVQEFEAIEIDGTISGDFPVTIGENGISVTGGTLIGDAPGGRIRYRAGDPDAAATGALDVATRALSNFVFDALSSSVDYGEGGDLTLKMRLSGRNPDLESNRPVVLNLSVESNIPQMLKSLQAARTVEDILEKRLAK